jgi:hypothetical protein
MNQQEMDMHTPIGVYKDDDEYGLPWIGRSLLRNNGFKNRLEEEELNAYLERCHDEQGTKSLAIVLKDPDSFKQLLVHKKILPRNSKFLLEPHVELLSDIAIRTAHWRKHKYKSPVMSYKIKLNDYVGSMSELSFGKDLELMYDDTSSCYFLPCKIPQDSVASLKVSCSSEEINLTSDGKFYIAYNSMNIGSIALSVEVPEQLGILATLKDRYLVQNENVRSLVTMPDDKSSEVGKPKQAKIRSKLHFIKSKSLLHVTKD